jgi:xanthine phosphoribosyltransferase
VSKQTSSTPAIVRLHWLDIHQMCESLADQVKHSDIQINRIVGIARGGMIPAVILSHMLSIRQVHMITCQQYDDITLKPKDSITAYIPGQTKEVLNEWSTLIVDDITDSGATMSLMNFHAPKALKACLFLKGEPKGDVMWARHGKQDAWVEFPWETKP